MFKKIALTTVFFSQVTFAQIADSTGPGRLLVTPPIASEGGPCNTNDVRSDANGNILYCQSGIWKPSQGSTSTGSIIATFTTPVDNGAQHEGICIYKKGATGFYLMSHKYVCPTNSYPVRTFLIPSDGGGGS